MVEQIQNSRNTQNGLIINEYTYGGSSYDYGKDIYPISVGGYILLGETLSYGSGGFDIYFSE